METAATGEAALNGGMALVVLVVLIVASGLITGALARLVLPGPDPMSWGRMFLYGIGGSLLGGIVFHLMARQMQLHPVWGVPFGVAGAALLIWFFRRRKSS